LISATLHAVPRVPLSRALIVALLPSLYKLYLLSNSSVLVAMSLSSLCFLCSSIGLQREDFERAPFEPEGRYKSIALSGTLGHLRRSQASCPLCRLILHALSKSQAMAQDEPEDEEHDSEWELKWKQNNMEYDPEPNADGVEDLYGSALYPQLRNGRSTEDYCIQLVDEHSTNGFLRGRLIPEMIDPKLILRWLRRCEERHGKYCKPTHIATSPHPALSVQFAVIDVIKQCLVDITPGDSYIALSYVWGQNNDVRTIKSLVSEFRKPGAFVSRPLPRTIRDAIDLTSALNIPYLWVDCLCIVQDEQDGKGTRIEDMDAVYGNAIITIVAAAGTEAQSGLSGWNDLPLERPLTKETIGPHLTLGVLPFFDGEIMRSPHSKRGWT